MGQTLSEPVVEKTSSDGQDDRVAFGVSAMQGWRISMEDAHTTILDLQIEDPKNDFKAAEADVRLSFFGVYDGHGGDKVALFAGENLHNIVAKQEVFKLGEYEKALKDGFLATDRAILSDPKYEEEVSGCTASVGLISSKQIFVANAGDSRSVLGVKGRAKPLSFDHKPQNEGEKARICAAGGFVDFGRVNGNLALSRAIGDFEFKKSADLSPEQQIVTAFPDVVAHTITDDDEFLVIACDGIWDCQSSQNVVEFVRRGIAAKQELSKICEKMMDSCLAPSSETGGVGCDNMTMIVVALLKGKTKDEWYKEIADRVARGDGPCASSDYAEFRGDGFQRFGREGESREDSEMDSENGRASSPGRIILLGDGNEYISEDSDEEIYDIEHYTAYPEHFTTPEKKAEAETGLKRDTRIYREKAEVYKMEDHFGKASPRSEREDTPAPQPQESIKNEDSSDNSALSLSGHITSTDTDRTEAKRISESAIPEKLVSPAKT